MESTLNHLARALDIIQSALEEDTSISYPTELPGGYPYSITPAEDSPAVVPQTSEDNEQVTTSSATVDHSVWEHEIASSEDEEDNQGIDRIGVYEYDLGQYGDSVSSIDLSAVPGDAELNLIGWDAAGNAVVSIGEDGVIITVEASASAYLAELEYGADVGPLGIDIEALVGARADASADFAINPMEGDFEIELQAGVVVGATVNANGELDLHYMSVEAGATGIAGFAAEGNLEFGFDDWEFEMDAGGKLAFLLGGGVDFSVSVDGKEIVMDMANGAELVWDGAGNAVGFAWEHGSNALDAIIPGDGIPFFGD